MNAPLSPRIGERPSHVLLAVGAFGFQRVMGSASKSDVFRVRASSASLRSLVIELEECSCLAAATVRGDERALQTIAFDDFAPGFAGDTRALGGSSLTLRVKGSRSDAAWGAPSLNPYVIPRLAVIANCEL